MKAKFCMNIYSLKQKIKELKTSAVLPLAASFSLGLVAGIYFCNRPGTPDNDQSYQVRQGNYEFINPLVECEISGNLFRKYKPFENEAKNKISRIMSDQDGSNYAVYFRNLNNGPWFGINSTEKFMPASLLKVPLMIAYLKESEHDPEILKRRISYAPIQETTITQEIEPKEKIVQSQTYTIEDLVYRMIVYSDNEATQLLLNNIPEEKLSLVYQDLGIDTPAVEDSGNDFMSVKSYSSFFRILYNAAYLSRENSEKALSILFKSEYKEGLVAGVPSEIKVAHKFGEYGSREIYSEATHQLHDCGIVYFPDYPYLLCVMTRGENIEENQKKIAMISAAIYETVNSYYGSD